MSYIVLTFHSMRGRFFYACLTRLVQTLLKNLFNSMHLFKIFLFVILTKIFRKPSVKGKSRYRKINFFTTSALFDCIIWVNLPCGVMTKCLELMRKKDIDTGLIGVSPQ